MSFINNTIKDAEEPSFGVPNKTIVPTDTSGDQTDTQLVDQPKSLPSVIKATFKIGDSTYSGDIQLTEGPGVVVPKPASTGVLNKITNVFNRKGGKTKKSRRGRGRTLRKKRRN